MYSHLFSGDVIGRLEKLTVTEIRSSASTAVFTGISPAELAGRPSLVGLDMGNLQSVFQTGIAATYGDYYADAWISYLQIPRPDPVPLFGEIPEVGIPGDLSSLFTVKLPEKKGDQIGLISTDFSHTFRTVCRTISRNIASGLAVRDTEKRNLERFIARVHPSR